MMRVHNGAIDQNDLAHLKRLGLASGVDLAIPAPWANKRPHFNVTRFVKGRTFFSVVHIKPVYYEARDHSMRPLSEVCWYHGNRNVVLMPWADALVHPRYKAWLAKRCEILGGKLTVLGGSATRRETPEAERAIYEVAAAMRGKRFLTTTVYPEPDVASVAGDGVLRWGKSDTSFTTIRDDTTSGDAQMAYTSPSLGTGDVGRLQAHTVSNQYHEMFRSGHCYDASSIGDSHVISAATESLYGTGLSNTATVWTANEIALDVCAFSPASYVTFVTGDWDAYGSVSFGGIAAASWNSSGYNDMAFNASGIAAISKTGVTPLGHRVGCDMDNDEPTWESGKIIGYGASYADQGGTGQDPKLVATHAAITHRDFLPM